jgi:alkanesulfonate monooxygenase SsuD/methylene tetrahydromethanopterin reductase-like flavin-dependent oxidoreductase (luciferase family)
MHIGMGTGFAHQRGEAYSDARLIREEFENCVLAEELGFDSVWITEHHFSDYSICPNPLQALSYLAGRTRRMLLGTQVIVVPWHDPVRLAEQIIMLDHVSEGRTILGFGRGLARHEFAGLRIDQAKAKELYNEILGLVIPALESGVMAGEGEMFRQPRVELRPRPWRSFAGRKFCGSYSESSLRTAAELGFGRIVLMLPQRGTMPEPDDYAPVWREVHGPGTAPPRPCVSGQILVDASADRALEVGARHVAHTMRAAIVNYEMDSDVVSKIPGYEGYAKRVIPPEKIEESVAAFGQTVISGTPQMVIERLAELKEIYDPQAFMPHLYYGGMAQDEAVRNMRMFAAEVMPEVKSWTAASSLDDVFMRDAA